jgi:hypothetical protein
MALATNKLFGGVITHLLRGSARGRCQDCGRVENPKKGNPNTR